MAKLRSVAICSFLTCLGSVLVSFLLATIAYSRSGADSVFGNALLCATTGGFAGAPLDGGWRVAVVVPCAVYALAGWAFVLASALFIILRLAPIRERNEER